MSESTMKEFFCQKPVNNLNSEYPNESNSKFSQECGTPLSGKVTTQRRTKAKAADPQAGVLIEPPPSTGITIEFQYSSDQSFKFAVKCAKKFHTFRQYGDDEKAIYRITLKANEMDFATELIDHLKGLQKRAVYVDGEKVTWESVFSFAWCYERRKSSLKPELYCFGYENGRDFNAWGCIKALLPFTENSKWFCWGSWLNDKGDWKFNKERIRHELQKRLYPHRFCPAYQPELVEDVLNALPDVVNPHKDKNWKFIMRWGDESTPGLVLTLNRFGIKEKVVMIGVCPSGEGFIKDLAKRMKYPLPQGLNTLRVVPEPVEIISLLPTTL